jgi:hypothetical protein
VAVFVARSLSPPADGGRRGERAARPRPRRAHGEAGIATLALVLTMPAVLFLLMSVAQFVVYYHASHLATAAAQEGVRAAQVADGTAADGQTSAQDFLAQAGPALVLSPVVTVTRDADNARVEVSAHAPQLIPGIQLGIHAVASGPTEQFVADPG